MYRGGPNRASSLANWFELNAPERTVQPAPHAAEVPEALAWKFCVAFFGCACEAAGAFPAVPASMFLEKAAYGSGSASAMTAAVPTSNFFIVTPLVVPIGIHQICLTCD